MTRHATLQLRCLRHLRLRPLILNGIGFDKFRTSLLNMPFGAFQIVVIFLGSYAECIFKLKSAVTAFLVPPVLILYALPPNEAGLLARYCLLTFLHGANPPIVSGISTNTAGATKKSVVLTGSTPRARAGTSSLASPQPLKRCQRTSNGKPSDIHDASMNKRYRQLTQAQRQRATRSDGLGE
ncbi:hypothetical protein B0H10DRAFT_1939938 [Mycena sp. CBHHK59/15]|nr:hypothetical protein B0H10DRAFT_1939938 [Mycena sp. CBHHK59/15]